MAQFLILFVHLGGAPFSRFLPSSVREKPFVFKGNPAFSAIFHIAEIAFFDSHMFVRFFSIQGQDFVLYFGVARERISLFSRAVTMDRDLMEKGGKPAGSPVFSRITEDIDV